MLVANAMRIRTKMLLVMLPLLAATTVITGIFSSVSAQSGMMRIALRLQAFKAEELAGYMRSQWDLLLENGLADSPSFVDAAESNVEAFAVGLIRSTSEVILAVDSAGRLAMRTRDVAPAKGESEVRVSGAHPEGWVDVTIGGTRFVGHTFYFVPFQWSAFVLEEHSRFVAEIRQITRGSVFMLAAALAIGAALVLIFSGYLTRPLARVVSAMGRIESDVTAAAQIPVEYPDEIGELAHRFNVMTDDLVATYDRLKSFAFREALARKQIVLSERETLTVLDRAVEYRDPETGAHINRVALYARMLAEGIGLDDYRQNLAYFASPLHDIGKLGVPDSLLLKPGPLTPQEFEIIKAHPMIAYEVLRDARSPYLRAGAVIGLTHHERYDGKGYPQGLAGDDIPLFGRIVGLVDVFDALTTRRPYKEPWEFDRALDHLREQRGLHFEPRLVDVFTSRLDEVHRIHVENRE